jgi:hypothetical protein
VCPLNVGRKIEVGCISALRLGLSDSMSDLARTDPSAVRIATDLNLFLPQSKKVANESEEREALNKTRTWLICHNLDRSTATQFGKPPSIKEDS